MNILKKIKQTVYSACLYFTVIEFTVIILGTIINGIYNDASANGTLVSDSVVSGGGQLSGFLSLGSAAAIFFACLVIASLKLVWALDYSRSVKIIIHYLCSLVALIPVFLIAVGTSDFARLLTCVLIFTVIYAICVFISTLISNIRRAKRTEELEYESQFGDFSSK